jgi:hypothetical protein
MWVSISAIVSAVAAAVTCAMAIYTKSLAVETKIMSDSALEQSIQVERHHRQALSPVVIAKLSVSSSAYGPFTIVRVKGALKNVGPGPAVRVSFVLRPRDFRVVKAEFEAIGANDERPVDFQFQSPHHPTEYGSVAYYCAVGFQDLFGQEGWTIQRSRFGADTTLIEHQSPVQRLNETFVRESGRHTWRSFHDATRHFYDEQMDYDSEDLRAV